MVHFGGVITTVNNGSKRINAGDIVMAYAPSVAERLEGGRGEEVDKNGLMTLWYMPYKPQDHKWTCKNIQRALTEKDSKLTPDFKKASETLIYEIIRAAVAVQKVFNENDANKKKWSELVAKSNGNDGRGYMDSIKRLCKEDDRGTIVNSKLLKDLVSVLCEDDRKTKLEGPITTMVISHAWLVKNKTKDILGKAVTSADPGKNFEISLTSYAK
jgi:hypothetical protein